MCVCVWVGACVHACMCVCVVQITLTNHEAIFDIVTNITLDARTYRNLSNYQLQFMHFLFNFLFFIFYKNRRRTLSVSLSIIFFG